MELRSWEASSGLYRARLDGGQTVGNELGVNFVANSGG